MSIAQDLFDDIRLINKELEARCKAGTTVKGTFHPYVNAEDYFSGELANAINKAFRSYRQADDMALDSVKNATNTLVSSLGGMSGSAYAPVVSALSAWMTVFTSYLNSRSLALDSHNSDVDSSI